MIASYLVYKHDILDTNAKSAVLVVPRLIANDHSFLDREIAGIRVDRCKLARHRLAVLMRAHRQVVPLLFHGHSGKHRRHELFHDDNPARISTMERVREHPT